LELRRSIYIALLDIAVNIVGIDKLEHDM